MGNADDGAADGDVQLQPGLYRVQMSIEGGANGAPAGQFADNTACLTQEDLVGGYRETLLDMQGHDSCRFDRYELKGGMLDAVMVCKADQMQPETTARIAGKVSPTATDLTMNVEGLGNGEGRLAMHVVSERIGDCAGGGE